MGHSSSKNKEPASASLVEPGKTGSDENREGDQFPEEPASASLVEPGKTESDEKKDDQFTEEPASASIMEPGQSESDKKKADQPEEATSASVMEPGKSENDKKKDDQLEEATSASVMEPGKTDSGKKKDDQFTKTMDTLMAEVDGLLSQLSDTSADKTASKEKATVMIESRKAGAQAVVTDSSTGDDLKASRDSSSESVGQKAGSLEKGAGCVETSVDVDEAEAKKSVSVAPTRTGVNAMDKAIELVKKATEADNAENYEEALKYYEHGIDYFLHALKYQMHGDRAKESVRGKITQYLERAEKLRKHVTKNKSKTHYSFAKASTDSRGYPYSRFVSQRSTEDTSAGRGRLSEDRKKQLEGVIVNEKPTVHWEDVAGLTVAKENLKESVILPIRFPHLFKGPRKPQYSGILLFGPIGCGKSSLAKAVATQAGGTYLSISCSDLVSKWLNDGDYIIRRLFKLAKANQPAVILIDDLEYLCEAGNDDNLLRTKSELLIQLQQCRNDDDQDRVFVLAATHAPWGLDAAMRRRFDKMIHIPLPNDEARRKIFTAQLQGTENSLSHRDIIQLAQLTEGYSGADIGILIREALMMPLRKVQTATHFKEVRGPSPIDSNVFHDDLLTPCGPRDHGAREMSWMDIPGDKLLEPRLQMADCLRSLQIVRPVLGAEDLKKFEKFISNYM